MLTQIDFKILDAIQQIRFGFLDKLMVFITRLGDEGYLWIAIAVLMLCFKKTRRCGIMLAIALIMGLVVGNLGLKTLIARERPYVQNPEMLKNLLIPPLSSYSCPSGHTMSSIECAVAILLWNKKIGIPALVLAILIGFSRMYLYVHFLTDVLLGAAIGVAIGFAAKLIYDKLLAKYLKKIAD